MAQTITRHKPKGRHRKHVVAIVIVCILVVAVAVAGVLVFVNRDKIFSTKTESAVEQVEEKKEEEKKTEEKQEEKVQENTREEEKPSVAQYEGEDPNKLENITGVVSFAGYSEGNFIVNVMLDQELGNSGTCNFTLMHSSGAKITNTSATQAGPSTSFCSYSTPAGNVQAGAWSISVEVTGTNKKGAISGEANI